MSKNRENYSNADESQNSASQWGCGITRDGERGYFQGMAINVLCVSLGGSYVDLDIDRNS